MWITVGFLLDKTMYNKPITDEEILSDELVLLIVRRSLHKIFKKVRAEEQDERALVIPNDK